MSDEPDVTSPCCRACASALVLMTRMVLCAVCGNKRCPKATNHRLECTGSNAPGQKGSAYE